jgi:hypothetical protein
MAASENYLDPDVGYLLGMIVARGQIIDSTSGRKVLIQFPAKNLDAVGISKSFNQETHIQQSLYKIKERLEDLMEAKTEVSNASGHISLTFRFHSRNTTWRNLSYLLSPNQSYFDFTIPQSVFNAETETKKEFVRGIADCAGFIRDSNNYMGGKRRVYLEINNKNWLLPIQLCRLLQVDLGLPVQMIQWGHPNTRAPRSHGAGVSWAKEHQVKVFSEAFSNIGFYVYYKQEILEEFAAADERIAGNIKKCNPNPDLRRIERKPKHEEEKSEKLPELIRGKHFSAFWQICLKLGCQQCIAAPHEDSGFDESAEQ